MPKMKYEQIYKDLKQKIEGEEYPYQEFLLRKTPWFRSITVPEIPSAELSAPWSQTDMSRRSMEKGCAIFSTP